VTQAPAALKLAAAELRYLLARGYPREASLALVGNRHVLEARERDMLRRAVVAPQRAAARRARLVSPQEVALRPLAIDGHNQLLTLESALKGLTLLDADDGLVRDISRAAVDYSLDDVSRQALGLLLEAVRLAHPSTTLLLFDAPVSHSGELASLAREAMAALNLPGEARTSPYPETELEAHPGPVATADGPLADACAEVVDLAGAIIRERFGHLLIDLGEAAA
jgi:hypothetical protein